MSWRVCRILDFKKSCTSVHTKEDMAKMETASQLSALASKFYEDLPNYAGNLGYDRVFPGFTDDAAQMLETLGRLLEDDEIWAAYDEWHRFMNRWDKVLPTPLWVLIGTVIVEGRGPTVETTSYTPMVGPDPKAVLDTSWDLMRAFHMFWKGLALEIRQAFENAGQEPPPEQEVVDVVRSIARSMDDDVKKVELMDHWFKLVREEAYKHYGIQIR